MDAFSYFLNFPTVTNVTDPTFSFAHNFLMATNLTDVIRTFCNEPIAGFLMDILLILRIFPQSLIIFPVDSELGNQLGRCRYCCGPS